MTELNGLEDIKSKILDIRINRAESRIKFIRLETAYKIIEAQHKYGAEYVRNYMKSKGYDIYKYISKPTECKGV